MVGCGSVFDDMIVKIVIFFIVVVFSSSIDFCHVNCQTNNETTVPTSETSSPKPTGPVSVDILAIYVPPGIGNAVKLVWGDQRGNEGLNLTYGVYYGMDQGELEFPKTVTPNQSIVVKDLEFCTRYHFAVTMMDENDANQEANLNPNTIRTVITGLNHTLAPINLTVELEPKARPCLDIKWSAACPNVISPIGYVVNSSTDNVTKMMQRYLLFTASLLLISTTLSQPTTTSSSNATVDSTVNTTLETGQDTVIDLMELKDMTPIEYVGKRLVHMWNGLGTEEKGGKSQGFIGRCIGVAKKVKELLPFLMFGGGVIMTKLGFLLLFSLKTVGLLLLLVIFHVGAAALKAGAFFAHKKGHDSPLHVYVEGEHDHGPSHIPVGWDDRRDSLEGHDLYNMYEKLKRENALLKRYYPS
ncbi:uncharacterized protein LOC143201773 isoform X1 [Rhynchophorus ferrugineus]|uniref:uncharacterized protein LOC143201773 isoform X1 n=1 Tax=Rhynchophorus ferrugineus TaxID=354439 RepID=UPI003FCE1C93